MTSVGNLLRKRLKIITRKIMLFKRGGVISTSFCMSLRTKNLKKFQKVLDNFIKLLYNPLGETRKEQKTMNMNRINFDSIVRRDAYRNGFDVYEQTDDLEAMLSSTFHKGEVQVSYREDEGYIVYDVAVGVEFVVSSEEGLRTKLRELANYYIG